MSHSTHGSLKTHGAKGQYKHDPNYHKASSQIDHKAAEQHDEHHEQVAIAAYFKAEHRGFKGGDPEADWLAAEAEINAALYKDEDASVH